MSRFSLFALFTFALVSTCSPAAAQQAGLYPDALPDDVSFVRFVGFDGHDSATFAGATFALDAATAAQYIPVSAGALDAVAAGSYATVLRASDGTTRVIPEAPRSRRAKVALLLVNGTDAALTLRLIEGGAEVIGAVPPATAALREVNPVAVTLGVFGADTPTALAQFDVALKRGQNISFVADGTGVRMIENRFAPLAD